MFGYSNPKPSNSTLPGADYVQRQNHLKSNQRRGLGETTMGSQDAIITGTGTNTEQDHDGYGILMKTDIQMDVMRRKSTENITCRMSTIILR